MSQDDALRMAATVTDGFTGPLGKLRDQLRALAREGSTHNEALTTSFGKVTGGVRAAEQAVASGLNPALKTIGITSLTASAAILGVGAAMRSFVGTASSLGEMSRATGISAQTLRDFGAVAGKFNVEQSAVASGAQTFADKMRMFSRGQGDLWAWTMQQGRTAEGRKHFQDFAADLNRTTDMGEKLKKGLEELENIKDPRERRIFSQQFFGTEELAKLADGRLGKKLKDIFADTSAKLGPLDPKAIETAERFDRSLADLGSTMRKLGVTIGAEVLPYAERFTTWVDGIVSDQRGEAMKAIRDSLGGVRKELDQINWAQFGFDSLAVLKETTAFAGTLANALHRIAEALRSFREGKTAEAFRHLDGGSGPLARRLAPLPGDDKIERAEQADVLRGKIGTAQEQGALQAELLKELEERGDKEGSKRLRDAMEANTKNLRSLEEALKNLVGQGGATVQQQSFGGAATVGALIQKAAFGGGRYGPGGSNDYRLHGGPTGSNALGDPGREARLRALELDPSAEWRMRILRGERNVPLPSSGGGGVDIGEGMRGRPFGGAAPSLTPRPDSGAGRVARVTRGGDGLYGSTETNEEITTHGHRWRPGASTNDGKARVASWLKFFQAPVDQGGLGSDAGTARAMVAMMQGESSADLRPDAKGDFVDPARRIGPTAFGTAQWRLERADALRKMAARMGTDWTDVGAQQQHMRNEFLNHPRYSKVWRNILAARTEEDKLRIGIDQFENPKFKQKAFDFRLPNLNRLRREAASGGGEQRSGVERVADGLKQVRPWQKAPSEGAGGEAFAEAYRARQEQERERRRGLQFAPEAQAAVRAGAGGGQNVTADGRVNIHVLTRDPNPQIRSSASGNLFREIVQSRGRQMAPAAVD